VKRLTLAGAASAGALLLALGACARESSSLPEHPVPAGGGVTITVEAVPLNPGAPGQVQRGDFTYAGGVVLTSTDTSRLHGLSDLTVAPDGAVTAISDEGDLLTAKLALDAQGRLVGLTDGRISGLLSPDGQPLQSKAQSDAEGMTLLSNGDRLVSFERESRIWLYPAKGGRPRVVPSPEVELPSNGGLEALSDDPANGPDAYIVGAEDSGQTWTCRLDSACVEGPPIEKPAEFGLVSMGRLPDGTHAHLLRAWDPIRGSRVILEIATADGRQGRLELAKPLTVDNYEGLALRPIKGGWRIYLLSDDNFQSSQRTLLSAFDWRPPPAPPVIPEPAAEAAPDPKAAAKAK
jgi:hypothetical protein